MTLALATSLLLAALFDLRDRRIPNALTLGGVVVALCLRLAWGWGSVLQGAEGAGFAVLVALAPFTMGFLGGGDVKLLGVVGAFVGVDRLFGALLLVALVGGVLAVLESVRRQAFLRAIANIRGFARQWVLFGRAAVTPTLESPEAMTVPYGVAIAVGSLLWWFLGGASL
ncbi:MAG: prepilin peptidase [Gemmatimonadota bacterium]